MCETDLVAGIEAIIVRGEHFGTRFRWSTAFKAGVGFSAHVR